MTLGFTTIVSGQPNFFVEKIWQSLLETFPTQAMAEAYATFHQRHTDRFGMSWDIHEDEAIAPKHHSIRRLKARKWKPGNDIHFVINNRTANRFQFAPVMRCTSVQSIALFPGNNGAGTVMIDGRELSEKEAERFSIADGFKDTAGLFEYFPKPFSGQLVHWTEMRY